MDKDLKSVTILGKAGSGRECPFDTDEVWGVNNVCTQPEFAGKKVDKIFAFDNVEQEYVDGMKRYAPVMSWQKYADIQYPLKEVQEYFRNTTFFVNTVCYMLAYAAYLHIPLIKIYGVDVCFGAPSWQENKGIDYWMGRAEGEGCMVYAPPSSQLMTTVSGAIYGTQDHCNVNLYLNERLALINILPKEGNYQEALKAQNAWWVLFPKQDEAEAHNIKVMRDPQGNTTFNFGEPTKEHPQAGEWLSDTHMPPETWDFLRSLLINMEQNHKMPFSCLSIYEKLILSQPPQHN